MHCNFEYFLAELPSTFLTTSYDQCYIKSSFRICQDTMDSSQNYNLKWEEFQSNLQTSYAKLIRADHFSDVTLMGEDGVQIKSHRVILSATSPVFENILMQDDHPKPMIFMRGTKSSYLKLLMNYIYHGEVEVGRDDLEDFLEMAEDLKIKGLTKNKSTNTSIETKPIQNVKENHQIPNTCNDVEEPGQITKYDEIHSQALVKEEVLSNSSYNENIQDSNMQVKGNAQYACSMCGKLSITHSGLLKHKNRYHSVKTDRVIATGEFECKKCGRKSVSKGGLQKQNMRHHQTI